MTVLYYIAFKVFITLGFLSTLLATWYCYYDHCRNDRNIVVLSPNAQQEYENLRNYLLLRFQKPYTAPKIITLIASGVTFLAKVKTVDGPEKKQLVLQAIRDVITQVNLDDETKNELLLVVDTFGDNAIEE